MYRFDAIWAASRGRPPASRGSDTHFSERLKARGSFVLLEQLRDLGPRRGLHVLGLVAKDGPVGSKRFLHHHEGFGDRRHPQRERHGALFDVHESTIVEQPREHPGAPSAKIPGRPGAGGAFRA